MTKEINVLIMLARLDICDEILEKIKKSLCENVSWEIFVYQCIHNKICNIVYRNIENYNLEDYFDYNALKILRYYFNYSIQRLNQLETNMIELTKEFNNEDVDYALIKGFDIVSKVYTSFDKYCRDFNDIDILVDKQNLTKVCKIIENHGYVQGDANVLHTKIKEVPRLEKLNMQMRSHQIYSYVRLDNYYKNPEINECSLVDINFTIFEGGSQVPKISTSELLKSTSIIKIENGFFKSLDIYYTFIQLAYHLYKDTKYIQKKEIGLEMTLQKFCDIREYLRYANEKWNLDQLVNIILNNDLSEAIYFVLYFTQKTYNEAINDKLLERIRPKSKLFYNELMKYEEHYNNYFEFK